MEYGVAWLGSAWFVDVRVRVQDAERRYIPARPYDYACEFELELELKLGLA